MSNNSTNLIRKLWSKVKPEHQLYTGESVRSRGSVDSIDRYPVTEVDSTVENQRVGSQLMYPVYELEWDSEIANQVLQRMVSAQGNLHKKVAHPVSKVDPYKGSEGGNRHLLRTESALISPWEKDIAGSSSTVNPIFGAPLVYNSFTYTAATIVDEHFRTIFNLIPTVVAKCGTWLAKERLHEPSIFRGPGNTHRQNELILRLSFESTHKPYNILLFYALTDIAGVFLQYFRDLPEPLIPYDLFDDFLSVSKSNRGRREDGLRSADDEYNKLIGQLEPINQSLLLFVLGILSMFAKNDSNRYTAYTARELAWQFLGGLLSCPPGQSKDGVLGAIEILTDLINLYPRLILCRLELRPNSAQPKIPEFFCRIDTPMDTVDPSGETSTRQKWHRISNQGSQKIGRTHESENQSSHKKYADAAPTDSILFEDLSEMDPLPVLQSDNQDDMQHERPISLNHISTQYDSRKSTNRNTTDKRPDALKNSKASPTNETAYSSPEKSSSELDPLQQPISNQYTSESPQDSHASIILENTELQVLPQVVKNPGSLDFVPSLELAWSQIFTKAEPLSLQDKQDTAEYHEIVSSVSVQSSDKETKPKSEPVEVMVQTQNIDSLFHERQENKQVFSEAEITEVAKFLKRDLPSWGTIPRIYIVLRLIGCLNVCDTIVKSGFSDYELPFSTRGMPKQLSAEAHSKFLAAQSLVKTTLIDLECGAAGRHHHFDVDDPFPFSIRERLGEGGFGQVDRVISLRTKKDFALKRVKRKAVSTGKGLAGLRGIIREIEILKTLTHRHIVQFVGSYTDQKFLGLLMKPVAELDFSDYLAQAKPFQYSSIRSFFGCLTAGLGYLHSQKVRHKDITPRNILVNQGSVLLTDFGLARDFTDTQGSTSTGPSDFLSPRYAAPEVLLMESRNTKSDIWSLGIVFLEMIIVLKGWNNEQLDEFMTTNGVENKFVRNNRPGFEKLVVELQKDGSRADNVALEWVKWMVKEHHIHRPSAAELLEKIVYSAEGGAASGRFCGLCCREEDESDSSDDSD